MYHTEVEYKTKTKERRTIKHATDPEQRQKIKEKNCCKVFKRSRSQTRFETNDVLKIWIY